MSALLIPFGVLILFSMGGQMIFGPFVLVIQWILARVAARPIRYVWCFLAGALAGEIVYLVIDLRVVSIDAVPAILAGMAAAVLVGWLYASTTDSRS